MNVSTKTWLLEKLAQEMAEAKGRRDYFAHLCDDGDDFLADLDRDVKWLDDARRLVEQGPEDPQR
jgi:hypothetical protein